MSGHPRTFSFVDRIDVAQSGLDIRGSYAVPVQIKTFPAALVGEAVGQLAAWAGMAAVNFSHRPIAGLAARIELLSPVRAGQTIELVASLETATTDTVVYGGMAYANGVPAIRLQDCVGPMMPVEEFDDPSALRARFELLKGAGAMAGVIQEIPAFEIQCAGGDTGRSLRAQLKVPATAPYFRDHFPRRPVFPGTLLLKTNLELATSLSTQLSAPAIGGTWVARSVTNVKFRTFTLPGDTVDILVCVRQLSPGAATLDVSTWKATQAVCEAQVHFGPSNLV